MKAKCLTVRKVLASLDALPPFFVYYLARHRGQNNHMACRKRTQFRPTREEIARKTGIPLRTLDRLATKLSWDDVPVGQLLRFFDACGVSLFAYERKFIRQNMVDGKFKPFYLTPTQQRQFEKLSRAWAEQQQTLTNGSASPSA